MHNQLFMRKPIFTLDVLPCLERDAISQIWLRNNQER